MSRIQIRIVVSLLLSIIVLAGGYLYWTTTPLFAFQETALAVRDHDLQKFQKYIDCENLIDSAMNDVLIHPIETMPGLSEIGRRVAVAAIGVLVTPAEKTLLRKIEKHVSGSRDFSALPLTQKLALQTQADSHLFMSDSHLFMDRDTKPEQSIVLKHCEDGSQITQSSATTPEMYYTDVARPAREETNPYVLVSYNTSGSLGNVLSVTRQEVTGEFEKLRKIAFERMQAYAYNHPQGIVGRLFIMAKDPQHADMSGMLSEYGLDREHFKGLAYCNTTDDGTGENCKTGLKFMSPKANHEVVLEVELTNRAGNWRLVRLSNLEQFVENLDPSYASDFQALIQSSVQGMNSQSVKNEVNALTKRITESDAVKNFLQKLNTRSGGTNYPR
jgi:hypothetical protein